MAVTEFFCPLGSLSAQDVLMYCLNAWCLAHHQLQKMHPAEQDECVVRQSIRCDGLCSMMEAVYAQLSVPDASAKDLGGHPDGHLVESVAIILGGPACDALLLCQANQVDLRLQPPNLQEPIDEQDC